MANTDFTFTSDFSPELKAKVMTNYFKGQAINNSIKAVVITAGVVLGLLIVNGNIGPIQFGGKNNAQK